MARSIAQQCIYPTPVGRSGDNVAYTRNVDESLSHINKQSHKFSATGFIGGMEDNGRNRDSCMIEYIPGEYCWRPVEASGYIFIHCIFVGFKRAYKGKGYGSLLLDECLKEAEEENTHGVAVVTRKGAFMAGIDLFVKRFGGCRYSAT